MMVKIQIQIPDKLFDEAKKVAIEQECSIAEIVRRGLKYMTRENPPNRKRAEAWQLPESVDLGMPKAPEIKWTSLCREY